MTPSRLDPALRDEAFVARACRGDRDAFGDLVTRHQRRVWLVCRHYLGADEADAATQESFLKAYTRLGSFDGRAAFTTWLTWIAINTCVDQLRRDRRAGLRVDLKARVEKAELELRNWVDRTDLDPAQARAAYTAFQDARRTLEAERFEMLLAVRQQLSGEQWERLQQLHRDIRRERAVEGDRAAPRVPRRDGQMPSPPPR